jgi:hypothetical protein
MFFSDAGFNLHLAFTLCYYQALFSRNGSAGR